MRKASSKSQYLIGFVGQGYVGKHYALDFERRGFSVVRYSKESEYIGNREKIAACDVVFIAVPTPTIKQGFDMSIVADALKCVGDGKIAVIKSTILPGTIDSLQRKFPNIFVMHSPEFLREKTAEYDAAHPERNIIGIAKDTPEFRKKAELVTSLLPKAPYSLICPARDAELIKYAGNCFLYTKVIYINLLFDLAKKLGCDWQILSEALAHDSRIGKSHLDPIHKSGTQKGAEVAGRGAGGNCFIKDFAAFVELYSQTMDDQQGEKLLKALEDKNIQLLTGTGKDLALLEGVYGKKRIIMKKKK